MHKMQSKQYPVLYVPNLAILEDNTSKLIIENSYASQTPPSKFRKTTVADVD